MLWTGYCAVSLDFCATVSSVVAPPGGQLPIPFDLSKLSWHLFIADVGAGVQVSLS